MRFFVVFVLAASSFGAVLAGRIVEDNSGEPLASVELKFHQGAARELAADLETDANGRFQTDALPAGTYRVEVLKPNFLPATFPLEIGTENAPVVVRLVRCGTISGKVVDAQGNPVPPVLRAMDGRTIGGATVSLMVKTAAGALEPFRPQASSSEENRYRFYNLPPGEYAVALAQFGFTGAAAGVQLYPDNAHPRFFTISGGESYRDIDFVLPAGTGYRVSGGVALPKPDESFALTLVSLDQPMIDVARTVTEKGGAFAFEGIANGSYYLFVSGPVRGRTATAAVLGDNPRFARTRVEVAGQNVEGLALPVHPGAAVTVKLNATGACPKAAAVSLQPLESWGAMLRNNGQEAPEQVIRDVAPGRYRAVAAVLPDGCFQRGIPVVDTNGGDAHATVDLVGAGSIRGVLRGAPRPADYAVILLPADQQPQALPVRLAFPDSSGKFAYPDLRPGHYRIAALPVVEAAKTRWVGDLSRMVEIEIPGGSPTDVELPAPPRE